jgi:hypothetical protein
MRVHVRSARLPASLRSSERISATSRIESESQEPMSSSMASFTVWVVVRGPGVKRMRRPWRFSGVKSIMVSFLTRGVKTS